MYTIYSILKHNQILWHYAAIEDIQFCEKLGKTFFYLFFFNLDLIRLKSIHLEKKESQHL